MAMPLAVLSDDQLTEPAQCQKCDQVKPDCRQIDRGPSSGTIIVCPDFFWRVFPFGVINVKDNKA
jgi:hypothetical protein